MPTINKPILPSMGIPNCSDEPPSEGAHKGIIKEITPINDGESYFVTFELEERDSQGKPKFIWQEVSHEDMLKLKEEYDRHDDSNRNSSYPDPR